MERFATLITRACNVDYEKFIHPSFSTVLGQMSPFDAKILKFYVDTKPDHFITYTYISVDKEHFDLIHLIHILTLMNPPLYRSQSLC